MGEVEDYVFGVKTALVRMEVRKKVSQTLRSDSSLPRSSSSAHMVVYESRWMVTGLDRRRASLFHP